MQVEVLQPDQARSLIDQMVVILVLLSLLLLSSVSVEALAMTSVTGDSSASLPRIRERLRQHPKLSSMFRSEVANYGICTAMAEEKLSFNEIEDAKAMARRAIEAAERTKEPDNVYVAYAKGILADALLAEKRFKEAAELYSEGLKAYEGHYKGSTTPAAVERAGKVSDVRGS